mmetsp:Transcript_43896/g.91409  ORF Transcript_43896/g.91409 Transcript_43896/m.91409 type:complete len:122 (+) Transcript_43896:144-509(+)
MSLWALDGYLTIDGWDHLAPLKGSPDLIGMVRTDGIEAALEGLFGLILVILEALSDALRVDSKFFLVSRLVCEAKAQMVGMKWGRMVNHDQCVEALRDITLESLRKLMISDLGDHLVAELI